MPFMTLPLPIQEREREIEIKRQTPEWFWTQCPSDWGCGCKREELT